MGWKSNIGIDKKHSILFKYLEENGFYESKMSPRFMDDSYNCIEHHDVVCMRSDSGFKGNDDYTLRIFVSEYEAYMELQTPWRSLEVNRHTPLPVDCTIEQLDAILDLLCNYEI